MPNYPTVNKETSLPTMWFTDVPSWRWRWEDMCGAGGLVIWSPVQHDLGLCFQQLFLQIPVLTLLAVTSAYYAGRHVSYVSRGKLQMRAINLRCCIIILLTLLPILETYIAVSKSKTPVTFINFFLAATQCVTWLIHLTYASALRKRLGISPRGPVQICVLWTLYAVLTVISFHSYYLVSANGQSTFGLNLAFHCSIAYFVLQILYAITLLPSEGSTSNITYNSRYVQIGEQSPLLTNTAFNRFHEEQDPYYLGVALEDTTFLSRLLFYWVNPLVKKGAEKRLNHPDDLYDLPVDLSCGTVSLKLDKALIGNIDNYPQFEPNGLNSVESSPEISFSNVRRNNISLLRALHKCFWIQFYSIGLLKLIGDCSGFAGPLLLSKLVGFIENKEEDISLGYIYATGLFCTSLLSAFCNAHFNFLMSVVGLKIRCSLVTAIYRKTLTVGNTVLNSAFNVGEIVNFMSTDTDRIVNSCPSFHALWSIPFQLTVTLYLLYEQVGLAFLAGVGFSILLIPINKFIAGQIGVLSTKMMNQKDERVKLMTEVLRGIRTIKLHVWQSHFIRSITKQRSGELRYLKGRKYLDALCVYFWATTPVLISILTFGTYVLMGKHLNAATVFTSMALLNMLIGPLNAFPWVLNGLTEAWVSIKRVQRLLDLPDLDLNAYYDDALIDTDEDTHIQLTNAQFNWDKSTANVKLSEQRRKTRADKKGKSKKKINHGETSGVIEEDNNVTASQEFYLSGINLNVKRGDFIGIVGHVGSGKSSLLAGILAEIAKDNGSVAVADLELGFGFVTQQPWLQRGTLRENILFGKAYNDTRYCTVLHACCLTDDIHLLPAGDLTGVGEGGVTLSGGQKARVALARAVYQDKPIYLLDDIMSAVDPKVARHIYQHCIMNLLASKTRILCTHHTQYLVNADHVLVLEDGRIIQEGKPSEVFDDFDEIFLSSEIDNSLSSYADCRLTETLSTEVISARKDNESILNEESREIGSVQFDVYGSYWKAVGHLLSISILLSMVLMQTSRNMTDWWLSYWVSNSGSSNSTNSTDNSNVTSPAYVLWLPAGQSADDNLSYYMTIYGVLVGVNTLFTLFRAFLFAYGGITAAGKIHKTLLKSIMNAKVLFFDISPLGRILNRFSSDTYTIDDSLPFIMNILFAQVFGTIGAVTVTIYGLPWLCLVLAPLVPIYHWLQYHYRLTSRELKRLSSVTLSPRFIALYPNLIFQTGLPTIRALRATQRFKRDNEDNVEANQKAQFASFAAAQWLGLRLQFIGVAMVTGVGMIAVIKHQFDVVDPGLVGLAISYALSITSLLSGVVNAFTETEREMIAVERVNQYIDQVEPERSVVIVDPPYGWPSHGVISFNNVVMKYREHLPPSLKGISFETRPAEKIGVVGRTGAGKSSLLSSLFRLVELHSGSIVIDIVNIAHISLNALRSRLSIIPQDPFLFSGTVRENLDPLGEFRDPELWSALTRVDMTPMVKRLGGLDAKFRAGGSNLSVGQGQLVCLARAVLHNAKILCIDEATANVDKETDRQIQQTLRSVFRKSTVITIAHRVQTILDYDRVLVLADGQIMEFDNPSVLLDNPESHFFQLVNQES
ncbi:uncharacterized protein CBL_10466 [Carabus blaptoides fortunei]